MKNKKVDTVRFPLDFKPEILSAFKEACKKNGTTPTRAIKEFVYSYIQQTLTLEVEGYTPKGYSDEELITFLRQKADMLGRPPIFKEMKKPAGSTYIKRFGTWKKALIAAGLDTKESLIKKLQTLAHELGRAPNENEVNASDYETCVSVFGSWETALKRAGLICHSGYTRENLVEKIRHRADELGRPPQNTEMTNPTGKTYIRAFGTWNKALQAAGYKPNYPRKKLIRED